MADADDDVELALELLSKLEHEELSVKEVVDRIELVTSHPRTTRRVLEEAERRGIVERDGGTISPASGSFLRFESEVIQKEGEFDCRRCGAGLSTGHFVKLESDELGPFGSSCIRKVTGRD